MKQEQSQLTTEIAYFNQYVEESDVNTENFKSKRKLSANQWMTLWQDCRMNIEEKQRIGLFLKIKGFLHYGISNLNFYKQDIAKVITTFQAMYYRVREAELAGRIAEIESYLQSVDGNLLDDLCTQSMALLKDKLARKYEGKDSRVVFIEDDLWKNSYDVLKEYPVILSTTFSSRNSLKDDVVYDYLIMDEASQVDVATGALALSCARNVVVVGDTKQLPNVVTDDVRLKAQTILNDFNIDEGYQFTKSFLQSVLDVMPNVTQTLLLLYILTHSPYI